MKVLLVNGSGHVEGCTYTALEEVAAALEKNGIETEIVQLGTQPITGCIGCGACLKSGKCFRNDIVNEFISNNYPNKMGFLKILCVLSCSTTMVFCGLGRSRG